MPVVIAIILLFTLTACGYPSLPAVTPTPTCQHVPMPTGEGVWGLEIRAAPPRQVQQGQELHMRISGGVVVYAQEVRCANHTELLVPSLSTAQVTRRIVRVLLGEKEIATVECSFDCELIFTIPADTAPGRHTLKVVAAYGFSMEFPIEVEAHQP